MGSVEHFAKHFHQCQSPLLGSFSSCMHPALALPASQRDLTDFRGTWTEACQESIFASFYKCSFKISGNHLLECAGAVINTPARQRLRWGKESLGPKGGLWTNILPKIHQILFYHSKIVNWHTSPQHRDVSKARKGFVAESVSAWPSGLQCLRGDLANPEHDAICQSHPFLLCYVCNTPFMYPQQMADHLRVSSFKKNPQIVWLWNAGLVEKSFLLDTVLFFSWPKLKSYTDLHLYLNYAEGMDSSYKSTCD